MWREGRHRAEQNRSPSCSRAASLNVSLEPDSHVGRVVCDEMVFAHLLSVPGIDRNTRCNMRVLNASGNPFGRQPHLQNRV